MSREGLGRARRLRAPRAGLAAAAVIAAAVVVALAAGLAAAAGPSGPVAPAAARVESATQAEGFRTVGPADGSFSIDVPSRWKDLDLAQLGPDGLRDALRAISPRLARQFGASGVALVARGGRLLAIDPLPRGGVRPNVNVVEGPLGDRTTASTRREARAQLRALGATRIRTRVATVAGTPSVEATARLRGTGPSRSPVTVALTQYFVPTGDTLRLVMFTTPLDGSWRRLVLEMVDTFSVPGATVTPTSLASAP